MGGDLDAERCSLEPPRTSASGLIRRSIAGKGHAGVVCGIEQWRRSLLFMDNYMASALQLHLRLFVTPWKNDAVQFLSYITEDLDMRLPSWQQ